MAERRVIVLLTGEIASGKTTVAEKLDAQFGFKVLKTRGAIIELAKAKLKGEYPDRTFLQKFGTSLDEKEDGRWVLDYFQKEFTPLHDGSKLFIVDALRISKQIAHFRKAYSYAVFHIHLSASDQILKERFLQREEIVDLSPKQALEKYKTAKTDPTERKVHTLADEADLVINTELSTKDDVLIRVASFLKLLAPTKNELVDVLVGGQFGSEGKGQIAAHIAPDYDCLVRVGGPNAGHTVYEEPDKHVFRLLPSGCYRNPTAKLLLGPGTVLNIDVLMNEISKYGVLDEFQKRLVIDENAIVISQADIDLEEKVKEKIGSTAQGVGAATANNIIARLYASKKHKALNFSALRPYLGSTFDVLETMYRNNKRILLEGTQGTGLSIHHGLYPWVTSRDTTVAGCLSEAGISTRRVKKVIMVARTYPIRVGGTSGDFLSQEISMDVIAARSGKDPDLLRKMEKTTTTNRDRRIAEFSWSLFRKACELNSPTDIALTFVDYISIKNERARRYDQLTPETWQFIEEIERCSGVKVSLISTGFDYRAIIDRRNWK